jgi:hypothetical protein
MKAIEAANITKDTFYAAGAAHGIFNQKGFTGNIAIGGSAIPEETVHTAFDTAAIKQHSDVFPHFINCDAVGKVDPYPIIMPEMTNEISQAYYYQHQNK